MDIFCTYFDSRYLVRALPTYESLMRHAGPDAELHALCLDNAAEAVLRELALPRLVVRALRDLENADPALAVAKPQRHGAEYYFTLTPALTAWILESCPSARRVTYVDADLYFYSSLGPVFDAMGRDSILVIPHRFPERLRGQERYGLYNVGLVSFRADGDARACLAWWRERCMEWCADRCEDGRFADQKYLDCWPALFRGVHVLDHPGANLAPWNIERHTVARGERGAVVDGRPLIFYHFYRYRRLSPHFVDPGLVVYGYRIPPSVVRLVHLPYVRAVGRAERLLDRRFPRLAAGPGNSREHAQDAAFARWSAAYRWRHFLEGKSVFTGAGRAWFSSLAPGGGRVDAGLEAP